MNIAVSPTMVSGNDRSGRNASTCDDILSEKGARESFAQVAQVFVESNRANWKFFWNFSEATMWTNRTSLTSATAWIKSEPKSVCSLWLKTNVILFNCSYRISAMSIVKLTFRQTHSKPSLIYAKILAFGIPKSYRCANHWRRPIWRETFPNFQSVNYSIMKIN